MSNPRNGGKRGAPLSSWGSVVSEQLAPPCKRERHSSGTEDRAGGGYMAADDATQLWERCMSTFEAEAGKEMVLLLPLQLPRGGRESDPGSTASAGSEQTAAGGSCGYRPSFSVRTSVLHQAAALAFVCACGVSCLAVPAGCSRCAQ